MKVKTTGSFVKILAGMLVLLMVLLLFKSGYVAGKWIYKKTNQAESQK